MLYERAALRDGFRDARILFRGGVEYRSTGKAVKPPGVPPAAGPFEEFVEVAGTGAAVAFKPVGQVPSDVEAREHLVAAFAIR